MAAFGDLLQRIARSLEEARAEQQPGDNLRARLGYGTEDGDEDDSKWESVRTPDSGRGPETARQREGDWTTEAESPPGTGPRTTGEFRRATAREPRAAPTPGSVRAPWESLADASKSSRAPSPHTTPSSSRAAPPRPHATAKFVLSERIHERLREPGALREAFVLKELLDRPLGLRRRK